MKRILSIGSFLFLLSCANSDVVYEYPKSPAERRDEKMGSILTGEKDSGVYLFQSGRKEAVENNVSVNKILWQASLDVLSDMPIVTSDYNGGMIATDWYSVKGSNLRTKYNVMIKGSKLSANNIKVTTFCQRLVGGTWVSAEVDPKENKEKEMEILNKAREYASGNK